VSKSKRPSEFKRLKIFDIHMGCFDCTVRVVVGDFDLAERYVYWLYDKDPPPEQNQGGVRGRFYSHQDRIPVIWIPRRPRTPREHATVAHEALHATWWVMHQWAGMPFSDDTEETFTHALGHLVNWILEGSKA
jgi:hypothetical protein